MPDAAAPPTVTTEPTRAGERLDNFVDGALAFAATLLAISGGKLPQAVAAFDQALHGVPACTACFAQLALFRHGHVRWRGTVHGIGGTRLRGSLLLVLFTPIFVFPLHLVQAAFFTGLRGGARSLAFPRRQRRPARTRGPVHVPRLVLGLDGGHLGTLFRPCRAPHRTHRRDMAERGSAPAHVALVPRGRPRFDAAGIVGIGDTGWVAGCRFRFQPRLAGLHRRPRRPLAPMLAGDPVKVRFGSARGRDYRCAIEPNATSRERP